MFTPPASPLPSPQAMLEKANPMEEQQHRARALLTPPLSGTMAPSRPGSPSTPPSMPGTSLHSVSTSSYFAPATSDSSQMPASSMHSAMVPAPDLSLSSSSSPSTSTSTSPPAYSTDSGKRQQPALGIPSPPSSIISSREISQPQPSAIVHRKQQLDSKTATKRRIGRRTKWTAIAIPVVLALVTLGTHCMAELLGLIGWLNPADGQERFQGKGMNGWHGHGMFDFAFDGLHLSHPHHHDHYGHHQHDHSAPPPPPSVLDGMEGLGAGGLFKRIDQDEEEEFEEELLQRQLSESSGISISVASAATTATELASNTLTAAASATASSVTAATTTTPATAQDLPTVPTSSPTLPTPFPQPWDSSISQNFSTQSCYNFFLNMTNSLDFRSCRPFGMLESSSNTFANLQSNLTALNAVVWGTCNTTPGVDQCASTMATFASSLRSSCSVDLKDGNLNAVTTLQALQAYSLTYNTGCLVDPSTNAYCYVKAAHNTNPSDLYFYSLPQGISVSNTSTLTCSSCTKSLMSLYVNALNANSSQLTRLAGVYGKAQSLSVGACGSGYAKTPTGTAADSSGNAASAVRPATMTLIWGFIASLIFFLVVLC